MPSSSSESSSSSSKGFNGARCFWRLMMISPSFSFERTKGSKSPLSLFVLFCVCWKKDNRKKKRSLFDLSFFSWAPFVLLCHFYVERERERERDVKKRRGKKATKAPTSSRRQHAKKVGCSKTEKKQKKKKTLSLFLSLSLSLANSLLAIMKKQKQKQKQNSSLREEDKSGSKEFV